MVDHTSDEESIAPWADSDFAVNRSSRATQIPEVSPWYLERPKTHKRFAEAMERTPVILVIAPNGYGKSTFLAHELRNHPTPVAWLSADARMTVPATLLGELIATISRAVPQLKERLERIEVESADSHNEHTESERLIAECLASANTVVTVVIDGYECIESNETNAFVNRLADHLPSGAHLIIAASVKPRLRIGRLSLQGRLSEMGTEDFAFDEEESMHLLNGELGLELRDEDVARVNEHMDGWVAGLRMAGIALRSGSDVETVLYSDSESQRDISAYLVEDIVERQEASVRTFLLESSILAAFNAELCNCTLRRTDASALIERVLEQGLFLLPAGEAGWYRYANFFRQTLNDLASRMSTEDRRAAHIRASGWLADHNMPEQALRQAVDAGDYNQVVELLDTQYAAMMGRDGSVRMREIIRRLPEGIVRKSLWADVGIVVSSEMQRCFDQEKAFTSTLLSVPSAKSGDTENGDGHNPTLAASLCIVDMLYAYHRNDPLKAITIADGWLERSEADQRGRCGILNVRGISHWKLGEVEQARTDWQGSANLATYLDWPYSLCLNLFGIAHAHYLCGDLDAAAETCQRIFAISNRQTQPVLSSGYAHLLMAKVLYGRSDLDGARSELVTARKIAEMGQERSLIMHAEMAIARIDAVKGNSSAAVERANRAQSSFCADQRYRQSFDESLILMAQIWLLVDKPELAGDYLQNIEECARTVDDDTKNTMLRQHVFNRDFRNVWGEVPLFDYLYYLLQMGQRERIPIWLDVVQASAGERGVGLLVLQALVLKALHAYAEQDEKSALAWLAESLALAEPSQNLGVYLDAGDPMEHLLRIAKRKKLASRLVDDVLAAFVARKGEDTSSIVDPALSFTRREREVIQLLCNGATNDEIAKQLFLGLSTTKNHLHNIYTKLGVRNRVEAIMRLQEMGVVERGA